MNVTGVIISITAGFVAIATANILMIRYFINVNNKIKHLCDHNTSLLQQNKNLKNTIALASSPSKEPSTRAYNELREISQKAAQAIGAAYHSVSIGDPPQDPVNLKIILSTDPKARKIEGLRFPANKGLSGAVFQRQLAERSAQLGKDPRHYDKVDKAAKASSATAAALAIPLPLRGQGRCRGIAMFFKPAGQEFSKKDLSVAEQWSQPISRIITELDIHRDEDIPSIARGNIITVTVMFSDITGFSQMVAPLRTHTVVELLNEYYSRLLPIAMRNGAKLCEYVGDGMYIVFKSRAGSSSADCAIESALEMQEEYHSLFESWQDFEYPVSETNVHGIGVATGEVYSGLLGAPEVRHDKMVGLPINLAAHLCERIKITGGGILMCPETEASMTSSLIELKRIDTERGHAFCALGKAYPYRKIA